jgi:hypothetical protein
MVMFAAIKGPLVEHPVFAKPGGGALYDPRDLNFAGLSMGHILAGTLAALLPGVERWVLNVGGAGFTHLITRSLDFQAFVALMEMTVPDPLDRQKVIAMYQEGFDRIDAARYAPLVRSEHPERRVLMQIGLGDTKVPNGGSFLHARLLDLKLLVPTPEFVWGLSPVTGPYAGSALSLYDFGIDLSVYDKAWPRVPENEAHDGVRQLTPALAQMRAFLRPGGLIIHPCDGPCDPE